jgi:hypothetical protein
LENNPLRETNFIPLPCREFCGTDLKRSSWGIQNGKSKSQVFVLRFLSFEFLEGLIRILYRRPMDECTLTGCYERQNS